MAQQEAAVCLDPKAGAIRKPVDGAIGLGVTITTPIGDTTMFSKTKMALSAAIVLSTAFSASAATKPDVNQSATYTMIPAYGSDGGVVTVPDPDHFGQPQRTGDLTPIHH